MSSWGFRQALGDPNQHPDDLLDGDIVTALDFNEDGDFLAFGDRAGRIWLYQEGMDEEKEDAQEMIEGRNGSGYQYFLQFQSHEPEFDYLKSLEIEEKINMLRFCKRQSENIFLLSTNDKTVKLWKIHDKKLTSVSDFNIEDEGQSISQLKIPKVTHFETITTSTCKRVFSNAHAYHINSISLNADGETFISSDDLRVNLWNLDVSDQSFNIIDIKPDNMEDLTEVITSSTFHPLSCNLLAFSSSQGSIRMVDLRANALGRNFAQVFEVEDDPADKSFFSEIISSISDVQFTPSGDYLISRDYLTVKVWDIRKPLIPTQVIPMHDYLKPKLCDLYENDCIFDKFECSTSLDGQSLVTGSYNDEFFIYNWASTQGEFLRASQPSTREPSSLNRPVHHGDPDNLDYGKKTLHVAWHPCKDLIALASMNNIFVYETH